MKYYIYCIFAILLLSFKHSNALDNGLALTPPMGWLTWQRFRCETNCETHPTDCINEDLIKSMADRMVEDGYLDVGYEYIIIDDCWASKSRGPDGRLQGDPKRFPSGIKALAEYVHEKGLKFGIYGDYGNYTCGGYPGSLHYLELDAQTWADWGVDYLKLDGCYVELDGIDQGYGIMSKYLNETGRPIVFSCSFPAYVGIDANLTAGIEYCNLWRNYGDISDTFEDVKDITDWFSRYQDRLAPFAGPGHWNDPDMLLIGNFGLSFEQSKAQMTIWAMLAAPLIMSVDLRSITPEAASILQHPDLIRINQDPLGIQGLLLKSENDINVWHRIIQKPSSQRTCKAVAFVSYRVDGVIYQQKFQVSEFFNSNDTGKFTVKDIFSAASKIVSVGDELIARIKPTGVEAFIICPLRV